MEEKTKKLLQWHTAFYAGIQIELEPESENLIFENGEKQKGIYYIHGYFNPRQ